MGDEKARSSVGEHYPDTVGVGGSIPPVPMPELSEEVSGECGDDGAQGPVKATYSGQDEGPALFVWLQRRLSASWRRKTHG